MFKVLFGVHLESFSIFYEGVRILRFILLRFILLRFIVKKLKSFYADIYISLSYNTRQQDVQYADPIKYPN